MAGPTKPAFVEEHAKHLSFSAIVVIAANTMNGPGITTLPDVAVSAGIGLYIVMIALSVSMAAYVCRRMVHAMWGSLKDNAIQSDEEERLLGNGDHENGSSNGSTDDISINKALFTKSMTATRRKPILERTSIVGQAKEAYGPAAGVAIAVTMVASALCLALAQMVVCAAILDSIIVLFFGQTCALGLTPTESWMHCSEVTSMAPFAGSTAPASILSGGTIVAALATVGLGMVDLDEMMGVQYALFACLLLSCARFCVTMSRSGAELMEAYDDTLMAAPTPETWLGATPFAAVGPIMFNFAFVVTAPPLSSMATSEKGAYRAMGTACAVMGTLYAIVGTVGAPLANILHVMGEMTPDESDDDTNLVSLVLRGDGNIALLDLIAVTVFGFSMMASVPVYCLLAEETLVNDAGLPKAPAFFLGKVLPWILVALTYNASFFEAFVNWSGLLILGYANFSLPLALDARLIKAREANARVRASAINGDGGKIHDAALGADSAVWIIKATFALVTASISGVIAMSIANNLIFSGVVFVIMIFLAATSPTV